MRLSEIADTLEKNGKGINITRPCWNKEFLEFWISLYLEQSPPSFKTNTSSRIVQKIEGFSKCKDGTLVPDAFKLTDDDHFADDWVII